MPKLLSQAFTDYYDSLSSKDSWDGLISKLYHHQSFLYEDIKPLIEECFGVDIVSNESYLFYTRNFYQLLISFKFSSVSEEEVFQLAYPLYRKLVKHQNFCLGHLSHLYTLIISDFLGFEDQGSLDKLDLSSPALFQSGFAKNENHLPKLQLLAEKALLLCLAGVQMQNLELINSAVKCCYFLKQLVDPSGFFPSGLWIKESEYNNLDILTAYTTLFCFSYFVTSNEEYKVVYEKLLAQFQVQLEKESSVLPLYPLMTKYLQKLCESNPLLYTGLEFSRDDFSDINKLFGLATFTSDVFHLSVTCSGFQSGIGSLSKGDVKIVSMGPHLHPLGDSKSFGIHRLPLLKERSFKDIQCSDKENEGLFSGWTRIVSSDNALSDSWLYIQSKLDAKKCFLNFEIKHQQQKKDVYIAFFVRAEKATISTNFHLLPGSLDRYLGKAEKITLDCGRSSLKLSTDSKTEMQVIPLAGHNYFWDADFLVAYYLEDEKKLSFEIE